MSVRNDQHMAIGVGEGIENSKRMFRARDDKIFCIRVGFKDAAKNTTLSVRLRNVMNSPWRPDSIQGI